MIEVNENTVYEVECIGEFENEYVYDIEMDDDTNHTFFANDILIHNSCYLTFDKLMNKLNVPDDDKKRLKITKFLAKFAMKELAKFSEDFFPERFNATNTIFWDQELIARTGIWCQPKKYVCYILEEDGKPPKDPLLVKGLDIVRSSVPRKCRAKIREATEMMLQGKTEEKLCEFILKFYKEFKTWPLDDVAIPSSCNSLARYSAIKNLDFLSGTPQHMKSAITFNYYLKHYKLNQYELLKEKDKFKMIFIARNNILPVETIGYKDRIPPEFEIEKYHDIDRQFERALIKPLTHIFKAVKWKFPETKYAAQNIEDLFE